MPSLHLSFRFRIRPPPVCRGDAGRGLTEGRCGGHPWAPRPSRSILRLNPSPSHSSSDNSPGRREGHFFPGGRRNVRPGREEASCLPRSPGKEEGWMLFAEWGIFCRLTGVRLQGPRTFLRLVKLGAWVVLHRGGGRGPGRGPQSSRPGSCSL